MDQGDYTRADALFEESLALNRASGYTHSIAVNLTNLGLNALNQGHAATARAHLQESLVRVRDLGDKIGIAYNLQGMAGVAALHAQPERVARLWGAAEALREVIGAPRQSEDEQAVARARAQLDEAAWQAAWAEGRAMSLEQAIAYALEMAPRG